MNDDIKKHLRTQGKYMGKVKTHKNEKRCSKESRGSNKSSTDDSLSPVKYEDKSYEDYSFEQLEEKREPKEIIDAGKFVLSKSDNGESFIIYEPCFLEEDEGNEYYDRLYSTANWSSKNIVINGEEYPQPRLVAWYGPYPYSYSGTTLEPAEMPSCVLEIKKKVEAFLKKQGTETTFNSVLLNLYRDGRDSVAWHCDDEETMGICPTIASVSLGETRKFEMRPKRRHSEEDRAHYYVNLIHGSLVIMDGVMQEEWQHRVPKEYHDKDTRINLTFRKVYPLEKTSLRVPTKEFQKKQVEQVESWSSNKPPTAKVSFNDGDFPPLNRDKNFPPLNSDENFPPLNTDVKPINVYTNSDTKSENPINISNSSFKSDDSGKPGEYWDCETSFRDKLALENGACSYDHAQKNRCETNAVRNIDNQDNLTSIMNSVVSPSREEFLDNKQPSSLNALAKEFVPINVPLYQGPDYSRFSLEELLTYEVGLMGEEELMKYSETLKVKVGDNLLKFPRVIREEMEFMCLLTDGTQTVKNQRLITTRLVTFILNNRKYFHSSPNTQNYCDRNHRSSSYGKSNHTDGRRYTNQGRPPTRRY